MYVELPRGRRLTLLGLVCVIFFTACGGAYGLEPLIGAVGPGWAVLLIIITPLVWSLPIALMASELSGSMPQEGGYYVWVRTGLGEFWGVQEGWWTICYTAADMAIYPVLFVSYLAYFFPTLAIGEGGASSWGTFFSRWLIAVLMVATGLIINWRGARAVGRSSISSTALVLLPFIVLTGIGLFKGGSVSTALSAMASDLTNNRDKSLLALGLSIILWNYCGWDNVSTFAEEVDNPRRNYPRALVMGLLLTTAAYLLPVVAGIAVTIDRNVWSESAGWPVIGQIIGGKWLGLAIAVAALISAWSLFNSQLLYVSRLPYVMAVDGWLPKALSRVSSTTGVPPVALISTSLISALFAALPFGKLVVIDILLYTAALALEFLALIALRINKPEMHRPFRIPGGWLGLGLATFFPMACAVAVAATSFSDESVGYRQILIVALLIASGPLLYVIRRMTFRRSENC